MPMNAAPVRSQTAEDILDSAETLIQTRGYSAFSYQDIADALGIRKASIHYHFPSKTDLGVAVVDRYSQRFSAALESIAADVEQPSMVMLDRYVTPFLDLARTPDKVCLCGALAGEMMALPDVLRPRVERFFNNHHAWLAAMLARGAERGEFRLAEDPARIARFVFAALQGALLVKRTMGDASQILDVVAVIKSQLAH